MSHVPTVLKSDRSVFDKMLPVDDNVIIIVYVKWESRANFVTIFGDLYQNKLWAKCNNLNQFTDLSSASGPNYDVIKMAAKVLYVLMDIYK